MLSLVHGVAIALRHRRAARRARPRARGRILRITNEALHNALRHARADHVSVRLAQRDRVLTVEVTDDGIGFDPGGAELRSRHLGLTSMEERARELGGELQIRSAPGAGTTVRFEVARVIRVLLVDDHAVVREGLRAFLELQDGIEVVGEARDGEQALARAAERLPGRDPDGPRDAEPRRRRRDAAAARGGLRRREVVVLTSFLDDERLLPAIQAGRRRLPAQERRARRARPGRPRRPRRRDDHRSDRRRPARLDALPGAHAPASEPGGHRLTRREREVLELIAGGRSNKRIALELGISEKTVKTHVGHVLEKLGVADRTQAALLAVRDGLVGYR